MSRSARMKQILNAETTPLLLEVVDETHLHQVKQEETHFKIVLVSKQFQGLSLLQRHKIIYSLLQDELNKGLHALSLYLYTPQEYDKKEIPKSPPCRGGHKNNSSS